MITGAVEEVVYATGDGMICSLRDYPVIEEGSLLARIVGGNATTAFEQGVLRVEDQFYCPGYHIVEDRRIRCHKVAGHGAETFREGIMNSCNPVFMQVGERIGVDGFYDGLRN